MRLYMAFMAVLLVGDFNSHSSLWGCADTSAKGIFINFPVTEQSLPTKYEKNDLYLSCNSFSQFN
jgi:hypothetical protein